jgi:hypothetical protein
MLPVLTRNCLELPALSIRLEMALFGGSGHFCKFPLITGRCLPGAYPEVLCPSSRKGS